VLTEFCPPSGEEVISALAAVTTEVAGQAQTFVCAGSTSPHSKKACLTVLSMSSSDTMHEGREFVSLTSKAVNGSAINAIRIVDGYIVVAVDSAVRFSS
jgi:hypothetical protein